MQRSAISLKQKPLDLYSFQEQAFFKTQEVPAFHLVNGNFEIIPDRKSIIRKDTGAYISTVGKNYSIIDNRNYFESITENLTEGGIDYIPKQVWTEGNGKRTTMIVTLPQFKMYSGTSEQMDMELRIRNSFDTTLAADAIMGFLRLICTNGMTAFEREFQMKMRHKGDIKKKTEETVELYQNFEGVYERNKQRIEMMGNTEGNKDKIAAYIGNGTMTSQPIFKGERWATKIHEEWMQINQAVNLFALYNMFTEIISHRYGSNYSSKLAKMDELNREVLKWGKLLD